MERMRRSIHVVAAGLVLLAACSSPAAAPRDHPSPTEDPSLWRRDRGEPYPFVTPIPPRAPTPVDGVYLRDYRRGSEPILCRRCAPYRLDSGPATLTLREGRYRVEQQASAFTSGGHYIVDDDRLLLINDPNCPETRGVYRWDVGGGALSLEVIEDGCAFDLLRARYLSAAPWEAAP